MKLSTKGRYAVMAMVDLASHGRNSPVSLMDISVRQGLSITYLEQLFMKLRRHGLVESTRGQNGGYLLKKDPSATNVLDIMNAVEEPLKATRCNPSESHGCQGGAKRCLTHNLWNGLSQHVANYLASKTLADLAMSDEDAA
ncbi:MAG: Rrf2 family transcriptional regulator [Alphaproteobacteria bacterium]|nr:Rrf2 family transcriptional regulator [Alphaproteobacteria bacterium]